VSITSNGDIGNAVISALTFDTSACYEPVIIQVTSNIFAIVYRGSTNKGYIKTVSINSSGVIGGSVISTLIFDTSVCYLPSIIQVSSGIYAVAYRGASNRGNIKTISINSSGVIGSSVISTMIFDNSACYEPDIIYVSGNYYVVAYRGPSNDGYLRTVSIAANGVIGGSVISTLIFDAAAAYEPVIVQAAGDIFAIAYRNSSNKGYLETVSVASNGTISPTVIDTLNYEISSCLIPSMVLVTSNILAVAYCGTSSHGFLITIGISAGGTAAAYNIVSTAGSTTIKALVNTDNTTSSIVSWQIQ
jgi:hypothetical protein